MNEKDITAEGMQFALELFKLCDKYGVVLEAQHNFYGEPIVSVIQENTPHWLILDFSLITRDHVNALNSAKTSNVNYASISRERIFRRYSEVAK